jgi:hypothetical protein
MVNSADAGANNADGIQQPVPNTIYGKVMDSIEAAGYTYAEVDTGKEDQTDTKAAKVSPHGIIKPAPAASAVVDIDRVEGGNTIAEVYADKQ